MDMTVASALVLPQHSGFFYGGQWNPPQDGRMPPVTRPGNRRRARPRR